MTENGIGSRPAFSHAAAMFARRSRDLVERRHHGVVLVGEPGGEPRRARAGAAAEDQRRVRALDRQRPRREVLDRVVLALEAERAGLEVPVVDDRRAAPRARPSAPSWTGTGSPSRCARPRTSRCPSRARSARRTRGRRSSTSLASTDGCRKEVGDTIVPSRSDVVRAASALIVPQASSAPRSPCAHHRQVVVGAEQRLDPAALARVGQRDPVLPGHVLLALDHQRDPHGARVIPSRAVSRAVVWTLYAICVLVWSSTWVVIAVGLEDIAPFFGAGIRFTLAGVGVLVAAALLRRSLRTDVLLAATIGILPFATSYGLIYWAEQYVTSGLAAVLFGVLPLYVALLAAFLLPAEPLRPRLFVGVGIAFGGLVAGVRREPRPRIGRVHGAGRRARSCSRRSRARSATSTIKLPRPADRPAGDERLGDGHRRVAAARRLRAQRGLGARPRGRRPRSARSSTSPWSAPASRS